MKVGFFIACQTIDLLGLLFLVVCAKETPCLHAEALVQPKQIPLELRKCLNERLRRKMKSGRGLDQLASLLNVAPPIIIEFWTAQLYHSIVPYNYKDMALSYLVGSGYQITLTILLRKA